MITKMEINVNVHHVDTLTNSFGLSFSGSSLVWN